jgi:hypothetical protein
MKKLFILLSFLLACTFVWSQPFTVSVSGTVLGPNNAPAANVDIVIFTDSVPAGPNYSNIVQTNADGFYSDEFSWNYPQGALSVTMINCFFAPNQTYYFTWQNGGADFTADFSYCQNSSGCSVGIAVDTMWGTNLITLTANPSGSAPFVYFWNTGQTSQSITVTAPGQYCVTVADSDGCTSTSCATVGGSQGCSVVIEDNPNGGLLALAGGTAPFSYLWSNGSTTPLIFVNAYDEYCVTVTDASGCVASDCYWYGPDSLCSMYILPQPFSGGYTLSIISSGTAPFTYVWDSGETTQTITILEEGYYCATLTDANGCQSSDCISIVFPTPNDVIQGFIFPQDSMNVNIFLEGKVYLIQYDPNPGILTAIDSVDFVSAPGAIHYSFGSVPPGEYLVKAFLNPGSNEYENYLPTYHFSHLYWHEADVITVPYFFNSQLFNVFIIPGDNPGGPGFIGGLVSEGANIWGGGASDRGEGEPMANISILLLNSNEAPVTHTLTAADGSFGFPNLAYGTYKVVVEIPGLEQGEKWVTIGPDNPSVGNINFAVGESGIVLSVTVVGREVESLIYPNPVTDQLSAYFFLEEPTAARLTLTTADGKAVLTQSLQLQGGGQVVPVSVGGLNPGMYVLQVIANGWSIQQLVVKK